MMVDPNQETEHDCSGCHPMFHAPCPDTALYMSSELFVAGALSTMDPFDQHHPAYALPFARTALDALSQWEPTDA